MADSTDTTVYHLAPAARWEAWPAAMPYLPETYAQDGFIHCTAGADLMMRVANAHYRDVAGNFVVLVIDTAQLTSPLLWEQPAGAPLAPLFPHIYGPIDRAAVTAVRPVRRAADGAFLAID